MFAHRLSRDPLRLRRLAAARDQHRGPARRRRVPAAGASASTGTSSASSRAAARAPVMRIETRRRGPRSTVRRARAAGFVALKTIAAYRGGLERRSATRVLVALEANAATGDPLPVQVHTGFGDADLSLPLVAPRAAEAADRALRHDAVRAPALLPVRARGGLARARLRQRLLRPLADDPARRAARARRCARRSSWRRSRSCSTPRTPRARPELYFLGATLVARRARRRAAGARGEGEAAARMILRENALSLYRLSA